MSEMKNSSGVSNESIIRGIPEPAKTALSDLFTETIDQLHSEARQARILAYSFLGSSAIYGSTALYCLTENRDSAAGGLGLAGAISGSASIYFAIKNDRASRNADAVETVQEILNLGPVEESTS